MLACLQALAVRNAALLDEGRSLSAEIRDFRLGVDVAVIQAYADRIVRLLKVRDPLRERVHLNKFELLHFQPRRHDRRSRPPRDRAQGHFQTGDCT